ncbi:MAG: hypothetical protein MOB07_24275 [Acidobacteria bacterium]|nr:hypothetical protein [Acidobacteriota bacterium]
MTEQTMTEREWQTKFDATKIADNRGKYNRYMCESCGFSILTLDLVKGVTPAFLRCKRDELTGDPCVGERTVGGLDTTRDTGYSFMHSQWYRSPENKHPAVIPDYEWYRPTLTELAGLDEGTRDHVENGGLLLRRYQNAINPFAQCEGCGHVYIRHLPGCDVPDCMCPIFVAPPPPEFFCRRRMDNPANSPYNYDRPMDYWSRAHWNTFYPSQWPEQYQKPRTCSLCGCANPEDAQGLIEAGWQLELMRDRMKGWLRPPVQLDQKPDDKLPYVLPTPPVTLYAAHYTPSQWASFQDWRKRYDAE